MAFALCAACASDPPDGTSTLTLANQTWSGGALFSDKLEGPSITIHLARNTDAHACGWYGPRSVDIEIVVDSRTMGHVLPRLDLAIPNTGSVIFIDDAQDAQLGVTGIVFPTLTAWGPGEQIVEIDGTLDVVLADGRTLTGNFAATVCD